MKNLTTILFVSVFANLSFGQCEDFEVSIEVEQPICHTLAFGHIELWIDGAEPLIVEITNMDGELENPDGSEHANFLDPGWYYVYVEDADGCTLIDSTEIVQPAEIAADFTITNTSGGAICDGVVTVDTVYNYQGAYEAIYYDWGDVFGEGVNEITDACSGAGALTLIDEEHCSVIINYEVGSFAGIHDNNLGTIEVYTNPQTGELNILSSELQNAELILFNLAGEIVFTGAVNEQSTVFLPALETGVYSYLVQHRGEKIQTGKLKF